MWWSGNASDTYTTARKMVASQHTGQISPSSCSSSCKGPSTNFSFHSLVSVHHTVQALSHITLQGLCHSASRIASCQAVARLQVDAPSSFTSACSKLSFVGVFQALAHLLFRRPWSQKWSFSSCWAFHDSTSIVTASADSTKTFDLCWCVASSICPHNQARKPTSRCADSYAERPLGLATRVHADVQHI